MAGLLRNPHGEPTYWYSEWPDNYAGVPAADVQRMFSPFNVIGQQSNLANYQAQLQRDYGGLNEDSIYEDEGSSPTVREGLQNPNAIGNARTISAPWASSSQAPLAGRSQSVPGAVATGLPWIALIAIAVIALVTKRR